jgi:hypothetical protein
MPSYPINNETSCIQQGSRQSQEITYGLIIHGRGCIVAAKFGVWAKEKHAKGKLVAKIHRDGPETASVMQLIVSKVAENKLPTELQVEIFHHLMDLQKLNRNVALRFLPPSFQFLDVADVFGTYRKDGHDDGFVFFYNADLRTSFSALKNFIEREGDRIRSKSSAVLVVATMCKRCSHQRITANEGKALAESLGGEYYEAYGCHRNIDEDVSFSYGSQNGRKIGDGWRHAIFQAIVHAIEEREAAKGRLEALSQP